jgi:hypothetical protein
VLILEIVLQYLGYQVKARVQYTIKRNLKVEVRVEPLKCFELLCLKEACCLDIFNACNMY